MAGIAEPISSQSNGAFSALARQQYAALASMRWSIFRNGLRTTKGAMELGARTVSTFVFGIMALGIAFGMGMACFAAVAHGNLDLLAIPFWVVFLLWQVVPVSLASFQQQFDMSGVLRFPIGFSSFFALHMIFGLVDVSTIFGGLCCAGMWIGITAASPSLATIAAIALLLFGAFNVLLVRAVFAWIDRWLAQRRTREMVMAIFFVGILSLNLLNPAFRPSGHFSPQTRAEAAHWLHKAQEVQAWFPAGAAAESVKDLGHGTLPESMGLLALVGLYGLAAAGALGYRLGAEFRGENFGEAPALARSEAHSGRWLLDGSGPIAAVVEKDLRTLFRAVPLLYGLGAPLVMVFLFAGMFRHNAQQGHFNLAWGLPISVGYVMIGFTQLMYNNLGTEGAGIQLLFLSPTPIRRFILAKNMFHAGLFVLDAAAVTLLATLRFGNVSPVMIGITWAWVLFALPVHLAAGDLLSILMPYRINLGRIGRQKGAQANALLSLFLQVVVFGIGAGVFMTCSFYHRLGMAAPILFLLAAAAIFGWFQLLSRVDGIANRRREEIITELVRTE